MSKNIDFNSDLAQVFGVYKNDIEYEIAQYMSSVNIACGFHAGDPVSIREALLFAKENNLAIGAHIGFNDLQGFGYRAMKLDDDEIEALVLYQVGALASFAKAYKLEIEHVRAHGAMYRMCGEDFNFCLAVAKAVKKFAPWLIFYAPAGGILQKVEEAAEITVAHEFQLDKSYNFDGSVNFDAPEILNADKEIERLKLLVNKGEIGNTEGGISSVIVDTIHFSNRAINSSEVAKRANFLFKPAPVNYNKAAVSGWVQ